MPIAIEVAPQAQFAQWVAEKGGHMPGATPAAAPPAAAANTNAGGNATPAPAVAGTAQQPAANQAATAQN
jgi:cytochrome c oxidase subunit 2